MTVRGVHIIWWGGSPWRWSFYHVRRSEWGPFRELLLGPIGFTWHIRGAREHSPCLVCGEPTRFSVCSRCSE
jgi:hypothetical protein